MNISKFKEYPEIPDLDNYDEEEEKDTPIERELLTISLFNKAIKEAPENLGDATILSFEFISHTDYIGDRFVPLLNEIKSITSNETKLQELLNLANSESSAYAHKYISKSSEKGKKGKKASAATE